MDNHHKLWEEFDLALQNNDIKTCAEDFRQRLIHALEGVDVSSINPQHDVLKISLEDYYDDLYVWLKEYVDSINGKIPYQTLYIEFDELNACYTCFPYLQKYEGEAEGGYYLNDFFVNWLTDYDSETGYFDCLPLERYCELFPGDEHNYIYYLEDLLLTLMFTEVMARVYQQLVTEKHIPPNIDCFIAGHDYDCIYKCI